MNKGFEYLKKVIAHSSWHLEKTEVRTEDFLCDKCYPIDIQQVPEEFHYFWKYWAISRGVGISYTSQTILHFQQLIECNTKSRVKDLILELAFTIRFQLPLLNFNLLLESIQFYWEVTDQFTNWKVYLADEFSEKSSNMSDNENIQATTLTSTWGGNDNEGDISKDTVVELISSEKKLKKRPVQTSILHINDEFEDHINNNLYSSVWEK